MFVRWQVRKYKRGGDAWYASLCESKRVEGKVTSCYLGYIGSIAANDIKDREKRTVFWQQARANLECHNLPQEQAEQIESSLSQRVPYPNANRLIQHSTGNDEWYTPPEWVALAQYGSVKAYAVLTSRKVGASTLYPVPLCAGFLEGNFDTRFLTTLGLLL